MLVSDEVACGGAVGVKEDLLVESGVEWIERQNGVAHVFAVWSDWLADDRAVAAHAGMRSGRCNGAINTGELHLEKIRKEKLGVGSEDKYAGWIGCFLLLNS